MVQVTDVYMYGHIYETVHIAVNIAYIIMESSRMSLALNRE